MFRVIRPPRIVYGVNVKCISTLSIKLPVIDKSASTAKSKSWKKIPGPSTLPVIGQLHHFLPGGSLYKAEGYNMWNQLHNSYGKIVRLESILKPTTLVLYDPKYIAEVLHSENWAPVRPAFFSLKYFRKYYNRTKEESQRTAGLAIEDGQLWRDMRTKVNPVLMMPNIVKMYTPTIDKVALDMVERIKSLRDENNMIRGTLDKEMNLWSLESTGIIALGTRLNCFDDNLGPNSPAKTLIQSTQALFDIADKLDFKPSIWKYIATPTFKRAMNVYTDIEKSTGEFISNALVNIKAVGHIADSEKSVLEKLLEIDEHVAHVMATDMLIAGVDTTSNTILSALYLLAKHPEKQQKLREDILSKGNGQYLKACLKESLRLMPTVGLNYRVTTKEYDILGYKIPKDIGIIFCHHVLGMMESNFLKSKDFIPERWLVPKEDPLSHKNSHPFVYQPFGFGVRTCVGRRIAELEVETLLARLVESFEVSWEGAPPDVIFSHINYMKGPYNFVFNDVQK